MDPFKSAPNIAADLNESLDKSVSADTIRRSIKRAVYALYQHENNFFRRGYPKY